MEVFLGGCSGIKDPIDANGKKIKEGDQLTWDFHDNFYQKKGVEDWMKRPVFIVEKHESGKGLCAFGITNRNLYLHDFRFEFCELAN